MTMTDHRDLRDGKTCFALSPDDRYVCTRDKHQDGDHAAAGLGDEILASWPSDVLDREQ